MEMIRVSPSALSAVGYDTQTRRIKISFVQGHTSVAFRSTSLIASCVLLPRVATTTISSKITISAEPKTSLSSLRNVWRLHRHHWVRSNPSLEPITNRRPPGPIWWSTVHFRQLGPGVLPSSPA